MSRLIHFQTNTGRRRTDELDAGSLKGASDFFNRVEVRADGSPLQTFQSPDCRDRDARLHGKLVLFPSEEGTRCLDLPRYNQHARRSFRLDIAVSDHLMPLWLIGRGSSGLTSFPDGSCSQFENSGGARNPPN